MGELLSTKLLPPHAGVALLDRPRLLEPLAPAGARRAVVLTAPAGYGKTVLALQLARSMERPVVWYHLDEYDNDPTVFLQYLMAGVRRYQPDFGAALPPLIARGVAPHLRLLVAAFVNGLAAQPGLTFVLDDYYVITESLVHAFVQELLQNLPEGQHVIIATRQTPPLALQRLLLSGAVCRLGAEELRFTRQEVARYLALVGRDGDPALAAALADQTDGWPAALRLLTAVEAGAAGEVAADGAPPRQDRHALYNYLAGEVLQREPQEVREFLLRTAVLETLTPARCDALLERTDGRRLLAYLARRNLFVMPLGGQGETFRYHQLFRDFLLARLGAARQELEHRAGLLAYRQGMWERAVAHFLAAGSTGELRGLIRETGAAAFGSGRWQTVARWLAALTRQEVAADPWLSLYQAKVAVYQGKLDEAERWLSRAAARLAEQQDGARECRLLEARLLRLRGRCADSLAALAAMPRDGGAPRFEQVLEQALCLLVLGRLADARDAISAAVAAQEQDAMGTAYLLEALGTVHYMLGDYPLALKTYEQAAALLPDGLPGYYTQDSVAVIYQDWGEHERALELARRNVAVKEGLGLCEALPSAYIQLASIHADERDWGQAEAYYRRAIDLIRRHNGERFFLALNLAFLAQCLGWQGQWLEARVKVEEALAVAAAQDGLPLAVCRLLAAPIFAHTGDIAAGRALLTAAQTDLAAMGFKKGLCDACAWQAVFAAHAGEEREARAQARQALELAGEMNYLHLFLTQFQALQPVLRLGMEEGWAVTFVQRVLVRVGAAAMPLLRELAAHADAAVRGRLVAPLAEIGGVAARELISRLTADADSQVRQLARLTAQRLGLAAVREDKADMGAPLRVMMLGALRVFWQGREISPVAWRTSKVRDLLAYLAHRREPVTKEKIIEDLWPEADPEETTGLFHTTMYYLRRLLARSGAAGLIVYAGKRYQLRPGSFGSDEQQFQTMVAAARRGDTPPPEAAACLEQAVALYRGNYLEELDYPWVIAYQESLKQVHFTARLQLAHYYLTGREYDRAIAHLQTAEEFEPFDETVHSLLMQAYARQGNRAAVQKQFRKLEQVLKKELGLPPSREISDLYQELIHA